VKFNAAYPTLNPTAVAPFGKPCIGVPSIALLVPEMYSWKVSFELRGEVQIGLGLKMGCVAVVLVELLLGIAPELEGWMTTGIEASSLVDLVDTELVVRLDWIVVAELGLVEVRVVAGTTNEQMWERNHRLTPQNHHQLPKWWQQAHQ
jgi:hypothetical protein